MKLEQMETLNLSECCIFNESIKVDGALLDIVNDSRNRLLSTNGTTLFMCPKDVLYCEDDDYKPDIVLYAIQTFIYCIEFLLASGTIALHLCFKDLQTKFGLLIVMFCFILNLDHVIAFVYNRYQFTHKNKPECSLCHVYVP